MLLMVSTLGNGSNGFVGVRGPLESEQSGLNQVAEAVAPEA